MRKFVKQLVNSRRYRQLLAGAGGWVLLLLAPAAAQAQPTAPAAAATYAGPRFAGGPDSLRAYLSRTQLRQTSEVVFVQFEVGPGSKPKNVRLLRPPGHPAWGPAVVTEATRLVQAMPAWTPGRQDVEIPIRTVTLQCNAPPEAAPAHAYADEMPVFASMEPGILGFYRYLPSVQVTTPEILQNDLTGDVRVYLEVSETGRLEHVSILDGEVPALCNAARQTIARLPQQALKPAQLRGQPTRIYYVLSLGFESK